MNRINNTTFLNNLKMYAGKAIAFLLCTAVLTVTVVRSGAIRVNSSKADYSDDSKVQQYEDQIKKLEGDMASLKVQMANAESEIGITMAKKQQLDAEMNILIEKISLTESLITELEGEIVQKDGEIRDRETAYEEKYEQFKTRLRVTHEDGQASYLEMLFGAESLSDFLVRVDRVGAMLEYDSNIMRELQGEKESLESARTDYTERKAAQISYLAQLEADKASLESKRVEAANYINKLESDEAAYKALYEQNLAAEEAVQTQLMARLKELEEMNKKYVGGEFMWPVPQTYVRVTSEYGGRTSPITGRYEFHNGIDIPAPYGTNIYASNTGTVTVAQSHWSYGNYIMVDHGGGYATLYAHCSQILVKVGDKVTKGQVIGKVGSTGYSTGNHLHFSMYESSTHKDPRNWFPK